MARSKLKFNTDDFAGADKEFRSIIAEVRQTKSGLMSSIQALKNTYWKSRAGEAFLSSYEDGWSRNVDQYLAYLEHMSSLLGIASLEYGKIERKARGLKL